ncbi:MAG: hypothetical protein EOO61_02985 [Hymenobacter sp.]|nr:MAG: hypothetical protein EOO61_02985 [Hymenobacter sp.]
MVFAKAVYHLRAKYSRALFSNWKLRRRQLRRKLSMLIIDSRGQLVIQFFMQATTRPVNGL